VTTPSLTDILIREFATVVPDALLGKTAELTASSATHPHPPTLRTSAAPDHSSDDLKFQILLRALPVGVTITDTQGNLLAANPAFTQQLGMTDASIEHLEDAFTQDEVAFIYPDGQTTSLRGWMQSHALNHGCMTEEVEMGVRRKDASVACTSLLARPVPLDKHHIATIYQDLAEASRLKEIQQHLEHLAHHDSLTHLPNRTLLTDRLNQAIAIARRNTTTLAVCHLDLDNFKDINEVHGHSLGDTLLKELGQRIKGSLRGGDTIARIGGDEFLLLLGEIEDHNELEQTLARILGIIATPFSIAGHTLQVSASMGVTIAPDDSTDPDTLLRHADQAMYVAKQEGNNRYCLFDIEKDLRARKQRDTQMRIAQALENGEFRLYYQPKVNMRSGKITGFEALIRWQHPERGLLLPHEFLPQTEGHYTSIAIGEWVMEEGLRQVCLWAKNGLQMPVSVNIAAHHLQHPGFIPHLTQLLEKLGSAHPQLQPHWLELEILETAALGDMIYVGKVIDACRELGISFALDDFGTGYSSLTYLKQLKAGTLKIDQSFVRDMLENSDDLAIVEGVVGLTTAFRRKVIAEGVETIQHGMMLMHLGCDLAQGFGIARPMPASEVPLWVASFQPPAAWCDSLSHPWQREDFPLLAVEFDHQLWVDKLLALLQQPTASSASHAPSASSEFSDAFFDPTLGRFGVWYQAQGAAKFGHMREFTAVGKIHEHVYRLGQRIARLHFDNQPHLAAELISHLHSANEDFFDGLSELRQEMANLTEMPPTHWSQIHSA
jgi:diguanylate cyclase (GGDEF)-like protein